MTLSPNEFHLSALPCIIFIAILVVFTVTLCVTGGFVGNEKVSYKFSYDLPKTN